MIPKAQYEQSVTPPHMALIIFLSGLHLFSETIFTLSLPQIAEGLHITASWAEQTMGMYLCAFAIGTLTWGGLSDKWGRRPCVLAGLVIQAIAGILVYNSHNAFSLFVSVAIQAFGASIGAVLIQTICRDLYWGAQLSERFAFISIFMAFFSATGPLFGSMLIHNWGWQVACGIPALMDLGLCAFTWRYLPETHPAARRHMVPFFQVIRALCADRYVWGFGCVIGAADGILFSYTTEAPFCLTQILGLSTAEYGLTLSLTAISGILAGMLGTWLHRYYFSPTIFQIGLLIFISVLSAFMLAATIISHFGWGAHGQRVAWMIVGFQIGVAIGLSMVITQSLALALIRHRAYIGTAGSIFGGFYYLVAGLFTWGMGLLHRPVVWIMPAYFMGIACFIGWVYWRCLRAPLLTPLVQEWIETAPGATKANRQSPLPIPPVSP